MTDREAALHAAGKLGGVAAVEELLRAEHPWPWPDSAVERERIRAVAERYAPPDNFFGVDRNLDSVSLRGLPRWAGPARYVDPMTPEVLAAVEAAGRLGGIEAIKEALRQWDPIPWEPAEATELCAWVIADRIGLSYFGADRIGLSYFGSAFLRSGADDSYEVRVAHYTQRIEPAPGWNASITF